MQRRVVVTDSTASMSSEVLGDRDVVVVPLEVIIDGTPHPEGSDGATPEAVAEALRAKRTLTTSRPSPLALADQYRALAAEGATEILAVHLSGDMSATYESALLAAQQVDVPVTVVDTRQAGPAVGFAAMAGADALAAGASIEEAAEAARRQAEATTSLFYVATLDFLRRGGRIGAVGKLLGSALAVKPLLTISDGSVASLEKVRTSSRALSRLEELAVAAAEEAAGRPLRVLVAHLDARERAEELADSLEDRLDERLVDRRVYCEEIGAAIGVHVGPGMIAVVLAPWLSPGSDPVE